MTSHWYFRLFLFILKVVCVEGNVERKRMRYIFLKKVYVVSIRSMKKEMSDLNNL